MITEILLVPLSAITLHYPQIPVLFDKGLDLPGDIQKNVQQYGQKIRH
jgi:hypothetical protein